MANNAMLETHLAVVSRSQGRTQIGNKKTLSSKPSVNVLPWGEGIPILTKAMAATILANASGPRTDVLAAGCLSLVGTLGSASLWGAFSIAQ
jgi:hypothetical protein